MNYNFDEVIDRTGTYCEKFDSRGKIFGREDVIPLWVADMDFATPSFIMEAIRKRVEHPILGYSYRDNTYNQSIVGWVERRSNWKIEVDWLDFSPGVVSGVVFGIRAFSQPDDVVVIQPPVYHPFARQTKLNDRKIKNNPLQWTPDGYKIDFEDLDRKLQGAKIFLMCNPHNPTGRVYTRSELLRIGELCIKHDVIILSDEIHSDIILDNNQHIHIASISKEIADRTVTFIAPSKTFNVAGLSTSVSIASNDALRRRLKYEYDKLHADQGNIFGAVALRAAYENGDEWVDQMRAYISKNADYVVEFLAQNMPCVKCHKPQGTYLMWLDFRAWEMEHEAIYNFLVQKAALGLNQGMMFGEEGFGFMRMNIASPLSVIKQAMDQLLAATKESFPKKL